MHASTVFSILASGITMLGNLVEGSPLDTAQSVAMVGNGETFQYCAEWDFQACFWVVATAGQCVTIPLSLSSTRAAPGYTCYIWWTPDCTGQRGGPITNDDRHNHLGEAGAAGWKGNARSFKCDFA